MQMLEKLSQEQILLMEDVRDDWLELFFSLKFDEVKAKELVDWAYNLAGFKPPLKIIVDSPLAIQFAYYLLSQVESQVWRQVENQVESQVRSQVWSQVENQVGSQVRSQVGNQVENQVRNQVESQIRFFNFSWECNCNWLNWLAFFDYFKRIGIAKSDKFDEYVELMKANIFLNVMFENVCVISKPPTHISRDVRGNLHSIDGYAVEFFDGYGQNYLWGVYFPPEDFDRLVKNKCETKDIFAVENQEQRAALIKLYGYEKLIESLPNLHVVDTLVKEGKKHVLYRYELGRSTPSFLSVEDFSSDMKYFLGVPSECKTALEALAWTFQVDKNDYAKIRVET